jgi:hypothetical protein
MSVCVYSVFVLFCVQVAALRRADPPSKESYGLCIGLRNWKGGQGPTRGPQSHRQTDLNCCCCDDRISTPLTTTSYFLRMFTVGDYDVPLILHFMSQLNTFVHTTDTFVDCYAYIALMLILFLGCYTVWLWRCWESFGHMLPPSSGSKYIVRQFRYRFSAGSFLLYRSTNQ